jgi:hypothetical protein
VLSDTGLAQLRGTLLARLAAAEALLEATAVPAPIEAAAIRYAKLVYSSTDGDAVEHADREHVRECVTPHAPLPSAEPRSAAILAGL